MQCKQRNKQGKVEEPSKQANPPLKLNYYFAFVSNLRAEVTHKTEVKRDKVGSFSKNFNVYKKKNAQQIKNFFQQSSAERRGRNLVRNLTVFQIVWRVKEFASL